MTFSIDEVLWSLNYTHFSLGIKMTGKSVCEKEGKNKG